MSCSNGEKPAADTRGLNQNVQEIKLSSVPGICFVKQLHFSTLRSAHFEALNPSTRLVQAGALSDSSSLVGKLSLIELDSGSGSLLRNDD